MTHTCELRVVAGAVVLLTLTVKPAIGQEQATGEGEERPWSNTADVSVVITSGNTGTTSISVSDRFTYRWDRSRLTLEGSALRSRTESRTLTNVGGEVVVEERDETTAEQYSLNGRHRYNVHEAFLVFAGSGWERNRFAGIDNRFTVSAGFGYEILRADKQSLVAEVGGDWTSEDRTSGATANFAGAQAKLSWERQLNANAVLNADVEVLENLNDTGDLRINSLAAVTASVTQTLALKLSYRVMYDREPVVVLVEPDTPGEPDAFFEFDQTDTRLGASIVVTF